MKRLTFNLRLLLALLVLVSATAFAERPENERGKDQGMRLSKVGAYNPDRYQILNINNLWTWHRSDGLSNHSSAGDDGTYYPRSTGSAIYQDGMVFGSRAYVDAAKTIPAPFSQPIRAGGCVYSTQIGTRQGWVTGQGASAAAVDPGDSRARIYRVRRDWKTAFYNEDGSFSDEARRDAAESNETGSASVTNAQIQQIIDRYQKDWNEWPVDLGAPYIERNGQPGYQAPPAEFTPQSLISNNNDEPGIAGSDPNSPADQVIWTVFNDLHRPTSLTPFGSEPSGLEIQMTMWGYKRTDALGNIFFRKWRFINKGGVEIDAAGTKGAFHLDSMYVCQWSDPDLGNAGDDLTGCDTTLSLGFIYNGNPIDNEYRGFNLPPPAAGYDFLQGPVVASPGDRAVFDLKYKDGYKNLGMTGFSYFSASSQYSDPTGGYDTNALLWYKMLRGYAPLEGPDVPYNFPPGVTPGPFPLAGDPVTTTGHVDGAGQPYSFAPGDRRLLIITGPFNMAPADTQEVVVALVCGLGSDRLSSVSVMKFNDRFAQNTYNALFQVPSAPAPPDVKVAELSGEIVLEWGSNFVRVNETEKTVNEPGTYKFEGYNVYQLPTPNSRLSDGVRIATYDLLTDPTTVLGEDFDARSGQILVQALQFGSNSGITRRFRITRDYIKDVDKLNNGEEYYFAVTSYSIATQPGYLPAALESAVQIRTVRAKVPFGTVYASAMGDTVGFSVDANGAKLGSVTHTAGGSDGFVYPIVVNPTAITGHQYRVTFTDVDADGASEWTLNNLTTGQTLISGNTNQTGDNNYLFTEGFQLRVVGAPNSFKRFLVTANASGPLATPNMGCFAFNSNGFPTLDGGPATASNDRPQAGQQSTAPDLWGIHTADNGSRASFASFLARVSDSGANWPRIIPHDWEIRFTAEGSYAHDPFVTGATFKVPFELWRVGDARKNDPSDDIRLIPWVLDDDESGTFNLCKTHPNAGSNDHTVSGGDNDPYTDWIYFAMPVDMTPGDAGYKAWEAAELVAPGGGDNLVANQTLRRVVLVNFNGGSVSDPNFPANVDQLLPETGTIFQIHTTKPNTVEDVFTFTTPATTKNRDLELASANNIGVFPNPYYAFNPQETTRISRFVTFNNLPPKATIRIFNLAGQLVNKIEKDDNSQFVRWNLLNFNSLPVASGMYIAHVEVPDLGFAKVLKLAIIQEAEVLEVF